MSWTIDQYTGICYVLRDEHGRQLANVFADTDADRQQLALIAAAPDLYELLTDLLTRTDDMSYSVQEDIEAAVRRAQQLTLTPHAAPETASAPL